MSKHTVPVDEFTSPSPHSVEESTGYPEILKMMEEEGIRHIPVTKDGDPVGMISDRDLRLVRFLGSESTVTAKDLMSPAPFVVSPDTPLDEVALEMSRKKIGSAIILNEGGKIVGIFTATDALNALVEVLRGDI